MHDYYPNYRYSSPNDACAADFVAQTYLLARIGASCGSARLAGDLQLVEVTVNPQLHTGATVRWGGNVIQVDHDSTGNALIQVIERRLDTDGRPIEGSASDGRFMISAPILK